MDKVVPLLFVLKRLDPELKVVTVIDIERKALNEVPSDLLVSLKDLSDSFSERPRSCVFSFIRSFAKDKPLVVGTMPRFLKEWAACNVLPCRKNQAGGANQKNLVLLCINSAGNTAMGALLSRYVKSRGGLVVAYLKSVNDRGRGLSGAEKAIEVGAKFHDLLLVPNQQLQEMLLLAGYSKEELVVSGYPPFYRAWRGHVVDKISAQTSEAGKKTVVAVFARGPAPHKTDENQIVTAEMEVRLLTDIVSVVHNFLPDAQVWIKPHPYQNRDFLDTLTRGNPRVEIWNESVQSLSALADVAISTYSSASLDALVYGNPSIEYFEETVNFREAHPGGSTFGEYGVVICRNRAELEYALEAAIESSEADRSGLVATALNRFSHEENGSQVLKAIYGRLDNSSKKLV